MKLPLTGHFDSLGTTLFMKEADKGFSSFIIFVLFCFLLGLLRVAT
jgi:hypothetical protein